MNINTLPQFAPLVKDYLTKFSSSPVGEFFPIPPENNEEWLKPFLLERQRSYASQTREQLVATLREQHEKLGLMDEAIEHNLSLLAQPNTFAIVTGQQVGILGGPLYTFFKTSTTLRLAKEYSERFPQYNFVPVFWLETEDHDFAEVASLTLYDREQEARSLRYAQPELQQAAEGEVEFRKQAGSVTVDAALIDQLLTELEQTLLPTDFTGELLTMLRRCYEPGTSFAESFSKLIHEYFSGRGLLILNANTPALKQLAVPLFRREIERSPQLSEQVVLQTAKLEESYHAQVKPKAINLFYIDKGERFPIVEREQSAERTFFLKGSRKTFTLAELLTKLAEEPGNFSPNVVMRPLYQDTILPTAAYVAGPGEIAYFAQFRDAYKFSEIPMPVIAPRYTATLVEDRFEKTFKKAGTRPEAILIEGKEIVNRILQSLQNPELATSFENTIASIDREIESLRQNVTQVDQTLADALTSLKGKVLTTVKDFQGKTQSAERKQHQTLKAQLEKVITSLLPHDELQERVISPLYFLNKYGPSFRVALIDQIVNQPFSIEEHHVIYLGELMENREVTQKNSGEAIIARTSQGTGSLVAVAEEESA